MSEPSKLQTPVSGSPTDIDHYNYVMIVGILGLRETTKTRDYMETSPKILMKKVARASLG